MTKNGKHRILMPPECVMDCLYKVKEKQSCAMETAGDTWSNPWNLVFTKKDGSYICPQTLLKHFKALCRRAGIGDDFRFHDLRHTFAVLSLQEGDDIKTVQENLGHATASFTLDRYGHVSEKMHRESSERLQKYYDGIKDKQG